MVGVCTFFCFKVDCHSKNKTDDDNRLGRMTKSGEGEILDHLEIFNSVEVIAPAIDDLRQSEKFQFLGELRKTPVYKTYDSFFYVFFSIYCKYSDKNTILHSLSLFSFPFTLAHHPFLINLWH